MMKFLFYFDILFTIAVCKDYLQKTDTLTGISDSLIENTEDSGDYASIHTRATRLEVVGSGPRGPRVNERLEAENGLLEKELSFLRLSTWLLCWFVVHTWRFVILFWIFYWIIGSKRLDVKNLETNNQLCDIGISKLTKKSGSPTSRKQSWLNSSFQKTLQLRVFPSWSSTLSDQRTSFHCSEGFDTYLCFKFPKSQGLVVFFFHFFPLVTAPMKQQQGMSKTTPITSPPVWLKRPTHSLELGKLA